MRNPRKDGQILATAGPCMNEDGRPAWAHTSRHFKKDILPKVAEGIRGVLRTNSTRVFSYDFGATVLQEAVVRQVARRSTKVIVVKNGGFGARWESFCQNLGLRVVVVGGAMATPVSPEELRDALRSNSDANIVFWVAADTSVGIGNPSREFAEVLRDERGDEGLAIVDAVLEIGGRRFEMDEWGVDIVVSSSGKCLGSVANLGICAVNARAEKRMRQIGEDVGSPTLGLVKWWNMMDSGTFHHTNGVDQVINLAATFDAILGEDPSGHGGARKLDEKIAETARLNRALVAGLEAIGLFDAGFSFLVEDEFASHRLPQLTAIKLPDYLRGDSEGAIRSTLEDEHGVYIGGGLGAFKGSIWRIGIMGGFCFEDLLYVLWSLEQVLDGAHARITTGRALDAARGAYQ